MPTLHEKINRRGQAEAAARSQQGRMSHWYGWDSATPRNERIKDITLSAIGITLLVGIFGWLIWVSLPVIIFWLAILVVALVVVVPLYLIAHRLGIPLSRVGDSFFDAGGPTMWLIRTIGVLLFIRFVIELIRVTVG